MWQEIFNKAILAGHTESHGDRIYQCEKCDTRCKTKEAIRTHRRNKHSGIKQKQLTEEEMQKKRENTCLNHVKDRLKQKENNGGVLRIGKEIIKFNEYMKNWNAKKRAQKKGQLKCLA